MNLKNINQNKYLFCATSLDNDINNKEKKILSGKWCKNSGENFNEKIVKIDDLINENDYVYLQRLVDLYSEKLKTYLNKVHGTNKPCKYWNILVLPWLITYLPCQFYRWKILQETVSISNDLEFIEFQNLKKKTP